MSHKASEPLQFKIWNHAIYLSRAPLFFAPEALKQAYDEAHEVSAIEMFSEGTEKISKDGTPPAEGFQQLLMNVSSINNKKAKAREALQLFVGQHLRRGNLIGYGFEPPRKMDSQPFEIPRSCWSGRIVWFESKLSGQGLEFVEVRVITPKKREAVLHATSDIFIETRPPGRPGVGAAIEVAFHALLANGEIDSSASQSSHYPKLRSWLAINTPDLSTPADKISDKTLYKYFSPLFRGL